MSNHCLEDVTRKLHYFIRQWLTFFSNDEIVKNLSVLNLEYDELPEALREQLEFFVEEIMDGIDPLIEESLVQSERYKILPQNLRNELESDSFSAFKYKEKLEEAFECQKALNKIKDELKQKSFQRKYCSTCELLKMIQSNCSKILFK